MYLFKVLFVVFGFALDNSGCFYDWLSCTSRGYYVYKKGNSKQFWGNLGPVLAKLESSTFDKKKMTSHSVFSPGFKVATVLFILMKTIKLLFFY